MPEYPTSNVVPADPMEIADRVAGLDLTRDLIAAWNEAGWCLVPKEPTPGMFMRGGDITPSNRARGSRCMRVGDSAAAEVWRVMIEHTPKP